MEYTLRYVYPQMSSFEGKFTILADAEKALKDARRIAAGYPSSPLKRIDLGYFDQTGKFIALDKGK